MRSLFWRILGAFWLALLLTGALTFLLTYLFNQDTWLINRHPQLQHLAVNWLDLSAQEQQLEAQQLLDQLHQQQRIFVQVFDAEGQLLASSTRQRSAPRRPEATSSRFSATESSPTSWRRLSQEINNSSGQTYLFVYRLAQQDLQPGYYPVLPLALVGVALLVLTLISLLLTFSITKPLLRLRHAVHNLGATAYQQQHLAKLAQRKDELGVLAADFNKMGHKLQNLVQTQRQLLRDVSHELRSPLARLQIGLALAERAAPEQQQAWWPKLVQEGKRLDKLIDEILVLARMQEEAHQPEQVNLPQFLQELKEDCLLLFPHQRIQITCPQELNLLVAKQPLRRALDNLLRNALRFNPSTCPVELKLELEDCNQRVNISIRDQGPGVSPELLSQLTQPFKRAPNQPSPGYGLGLSIAASAAAQLQGRLDLTNHHHTGFIANLNWPVQKLTPTQA